MGKLIVKPKSIFGPKSYEFKFGDFGYKAFPDGYVSGKVKNKVLSAAYRELKRYEKRNAAFLKKEYLSIGKNLK